MKATCPECGHEEDQDIECDALDGECRNSAETYCTGCECWRCIQHDCECGTEIE